MTDHKRLSNFEGLRVLSMLMILLLHANYSSLGWPRVKHFEDSFATSFLQLFSFELTVVCVNLFILISGWFGICARLSGFLRLLFLLLFACVAMVMGIYFFTGEWPDVWSKMLSSSFQLWFIVSYLILYIASPVLNTYAEHASTRDFSLLLLVFFLFQFLMFDTSNDFNNGYSFLSFMGLYLLARFLRRQELFLQKIPVWAWGMCYLATSLTITLFLSALALFSTASTFYQCFHWTGAYAAPNVVLASVSLFLFFSRLKFASKTVNILGSASLMVYATHQNVYIRPYYSQMVNYLHANNDTVIFVLLLLAFVLMVYACAVLLHLLSERLWKLLCKCVKALTQIDH